MVIPCSHFLPGFGLLVRSIARFQPIHIDTLTLIIISFSLNICNAHITTWCLHCLVGKWQPTPIFLPGKSVDSGAWRAAVHRVLQSWTQLKWLSMHECIGEENGNPLQYSCLENPRDRGAWWAAVYRVAQSRTQLKWLSSSSSIKSTSYFFKNI